MFGCVIAGRLPQTFTPIDETHATTDIAAAGSINHISVFLLGTVPFPDGFGATVHFFWPSKGFQLLGYISNDKPSAIFRLRGTYTSATSKTQQRFGANKIPVDNDDNVTAILGVSIEPLEAIAAQMVTIAPQAISGDMGVSRPPDPTLIAERVVKNLFNYIGGFTSGNTALETLVPLSVIAKWYDKFLSKVRAGGIGFLENED